MGGGTFELFWWAGAGSAADLLVVDVPVIISEKFQQSIVYVSEELPQTQFNINNKKKKKTLQKTQTNERTNDNNNDNKTKTTRLNRDGHAREYTRENLSHRRSVKTALLGRPLSEHRCRSPWIASLEKRESASSAQNPYKQRSW